jgi:AraC-like DNA-binding protein
MPSGIKQAIDYIKSHWREGKTLKEIAQMHRVDPGNLARAFRTKEGTTIKTFVDEKRKEYVMRALKDSSPFGYEIGAELGFTSDLAFYR